MSKILVKNKDYSQYLFEGKNGETDLENLIIDNSKKIFGKESIYFPLKKKLKSKSTKIGTIPDGYLLDLSDISNPIFYIVEVELKSHDVLRHITTQIIGFRLSIKKNESNLARALLNYLRKEDKKSLEFIEDKIKDSNFNNIDDLIYSVLHENADPTVILIFDELDEQLISEIRDEIKAPIIPLEFKVFTPGKETNINKDPIYEYTPLLDEEEGEFKFPERKTSTLYKFEYNVIDFPNSPRKEFVKEHDLTKRIQGYVYTRDDSGNVTGIVFAGYKSIIDDHIKNEFKNKRSWWTTARPVDVSNFDKNTKLYVLDSYYDKAAKKHIKTPKLRYIAKIEKISRIDGEEETKLYP